MRWPTDGKFGFRESARSFPNFGVPGVHRLGSWNVLPGALPFLLSEQRGVSVIDLIARAGACDVAAAEDIYSRWLDKARVEDGISIPGVGELNHRYFRLDSQLDAVLNPLGHDPLPLKRRYSRLPLYLGIALFCTAAVGYGIWQYGEWMRLPFVGDSEKQEVLPGCRGRFIRPGKNRERNSRSHRR